MAECRKDPYEVLAQTIAPALKKDIQEMRVSCAILVFDVTNPSEGSKVYVVPKATDVDNIVFTEVMTQARAAEVKKLIWYNNWDPPSELHDIFSKVPLKNLRVIKLVSNFNFWMAADLQLAMNAIGCARSDTCHCLKCRKKKANFGRASNQDMRTSATQAQALDKFNKTVQNNNARGVKATHYKNEEGTNSPDLFGLGPERTIVPTLHVLLGEVNDIMKKAHEKVFSTGRRLMTKSRTKFDKNILLPSA
jgi:hypothetical protein